MKPYAPSAYHDRGSMFQGGRIRSVVASQAKTTVNGTSVESNEMNDTDFEEDLSDYEEFSGRRSEDSVSSILPF